MTKPWAVFVKSAFLGSAGLTLFYFLLTFLVSKSLAHPFEQFLAFQPWMSILIVGFGIQAGLFSLVKKGFFVTGTGAGMSGISMVACCAHHAAEILPILGASGIALFLTIYQKQFLILGIIANLVGIIYMIILLTKRR